MNIILSIGILFENRTRTITTHDEISLIEVDQFAQMYAHQNSLFELV